MAVDKLFDTETFSDSGGAGQKGTTEGEWRFIIFAKVRKTLLHKENKITFTCPLKSPILFKWFYLHAFSKCFQVMVFPFFPFPLPFPIPCLPLFTKVLRHWKSQCPAGLWGLAGCFQWSVFNKSLLATSAFFVNRPSTRFMMTIDGSSSPSWYPLVFARAFCEGNRIA